MSNHAEILSQQIKAVMAHIEETAKLCDCHDDLWWDGSWPAHPNLAAEDMARGDICVWHTELERALDNYRADLKDHGMHDRIASLDLLLEKVGCDAFVGYNY